METGGKKTRTPRQPRLYAPCGADLRAEAAGCWIRVGPLGRDRVSNYGLSTAMDGERPEAGCWIAVPPQADGVEAGPDREAMPQSRTGLKPKCEIFGTIPRV